VALRALQPQVVQESAHPRKEHLFLCRVDHLWVIVMLLYGGDDLPYLLLNTLDVLTYGLKGVSKAKGGGAASFLLYCLIAIQWLPPLEQAVEGIAAHFTGGGFKSRRPLLIKRTSFVKKARTLAALPFIFL
jgi:hypothetical protein